MTTAAETAVDKTLTLGAISLVSPTAAAVLSDAAVVLGPVITMTATLMDVPGQFVQGASQNPNNEDIPTNNAATDAAHRSNGGMSDPYESLYQ